MAHHKGCGEKLEEAREGKAMLKKAGIEDRQIVPKKCLEIQLGSCPDLVILNEEE